MVFEISVVELAHSVYTIEAESEEAARKRLSEGSWDGWRDLGHDEPEIVKIEEV
jgi:hypothetical protein